MPDGSQMPLYFPLPLTDLVQAQQDLRRHSLLLAWLEDKATFEQAHGLTAGDKAARVHTLDLTGSTEKDNPSALPRYYAELAGRVDNEQDAFNVRCIATVPQLHLYGDTEQVRKEAASYVSSAFSLLLSDEKNGMGSDLVPAVRPATILCAAWSYMARGLTNQGAPDSIGVCSHCGKFFLRRRTTKQYCSSSCRTMAQRIASQSR